MLDPRQCPNCLRLFTPKKANQIFCGESCRNEAWAKANPRVGVEARRLKRERSARRLREKERAEIYLKEHPEDISLLAGFIYIDIKFYGIPGRFRLYWELLVARKIRENAIVIPNNRWEPTFKARVLSEDPDLGKYFKINGDRNG